MRSKTIYTYFTLFALTFLLINSPLFAQSEISPEDTLVVGLAGTQPFVFADSFEDKGIAVDIWEELAERNNWNYKYKNFDTVDGALNSLRNSELDIVVGPISITSSRLEFLRFSQPFYNSSLAIVSRTDKLTLWDKIKPFFSFKLLIAVAAFLFILSIVGTLLWLAERNDSSDQFPNDPVHGIGTGMWLAVVTMSTVGYGDKAPVTLWGRVITGTWIVVSIIFATSMVAGIASTLTLSSLGVSTISNIEELSQKKAATIQGGPAVTFLKENKAKVVEVSNLDEGITNLLDKKVDAVVYDRPQLLYYIKNHQAENLNIAKAEYYKQGYGFAFTRSSSLVYEVNRALLDLAEHQEIDKITNKYLHKDE